MKRWPNVLHKLPSVIPARIPVTKVNMVLFISFLLLASAGQVLSFPAAAVYHVAPYGNDNNPGTYDEPWRTIGRAAGKDVLKPGDIVYIHNGTYNEYIKPETSGTPNNPITYRSYPGETPIISGSNYRSWRLHILDQSYLRFEGLTFQGYVGGAIQIRTTNKDMAGIEIVGNTFRDQLPEAGESSKTITVTPYTSGYTLSRIVIENNQFFNMDTGNAPVIQFDGKVVDSKIADNTLAGSTSIGIGVVGRPSKGQPGNILVKGNEVSGHGSPGKHSAGIYLDGAGSNIVVEENVIHDGQQGIKVDLEPEAAALHTRRIIVRRNVLFNNSQINLKMGAGETCNRSGSLKESVAVHNTIYSDINNITNVAFDCGEDLRWKNNIFVHKAPSDGFQYRLLNDQVDISSWVVDYNLFMNQSGEVDHYKWFGRRYDTLPTFKNVSAQDRYSKEGNPQFENSANTDFSLTPASPARDAGAFLTVTRSAGSGSVVPVQEAWYFSDGLGWQAGDQIIVGDNAPVTVVGVDYDGRQITVNPPVSWEMNDPVTYEYAGAAPDVGAIEFAPSITIAASPRDRAIFLRWQTNEILADGVTWQIEYTGPAGDQVSPITNVPKNVTEYQLTALTNYVIYDVTISAIQDGLPIFAHTVRVMPTDKFVYLALARKE